MNLRPLFFPLLLLSGVTCGCSSNNTETATNAKNSIVSISSSQKEGETKRGEIADLESENSEHTPQGQLFEGIGSHKHKITTNSEEAQEYFNQGLTWIYAFNHAEAIRSFIRATELDQDCAMAWWGVSLASGPHYNPPPMNDERNASAWEAMQKALERIENTTPMERALIEALKHRNPESPPQDRTQHNEAYAEAMGKIWQSYPDDTDVGTLYAEAMMVRRPWKLYSLEHEPHEDTPIILETLERVLELEPEHPGASHLYIHTVEPSNAPDRGLVAAERLSDLVPASGHLLHMPAHIYVKTGYWEKAIDQSVKAMRSDKAYRILSPQQEVQHVYMTHNAHMLAYAAMMSGREKEAMDAARDMWENVTEETLKQLGPGLDRWMCSVYDVQKRFGRWDAILNEPSPYDFMPVTKAQWHAARAVAYAAKKDFENAELEHVAFKKTKLSIPVNTPWGRDFAQRVLEVGDYFIEGEIALQKDEWDKAAELLEQAAAVEDTLSYGEPPQWLQPVRHTLGAVYLKSGNFSEAERVYREDLAKWPNNGWSLYGLSRALEQQEKTEEAKEALEKYQRFWAKADAPIATSCKCIPKT